MSASALLEAVAHLPRGLTVQDYALTLFHLKLRHGKPVREALPSKMGAKNRWLRAGLVWRGRTSTLRKTQRLDRRAA